MNKKSSSQAEYGLCLFWGVGVGRGNSPKGWGGREEQAGKKPEGRRSRVLKREAARREHKGCGKREWHRGSKSARPQTHNNQES